MVARYGELPGELVETVKKSTNREDVFDKEKTVLFGKPTVDLRTAWLMSASSLVRRKRRKRSAV